MADTHIRTTVGMYRIRIHSYRSTRADPRRCTLRLTPAMLPGVRGRPISAGALYTDNATFRSGNKRTERELRTKRRRRVLSFLQLLLSTSRPPRYVASRDQAIFEVSAEDDRLPIILRGCPPEPWGNPSGLRGNEVRIKSLAGQTSRRDVCFAPKSRHWLRAYLAAAA